MERGGLFVDDGNRAWREFSFTGRRAAAQLGGFIYRAAMREEFIFMEAKVQKKIQEPNVLLFLFFMLIVSAVLTHIVPAGSYDRYFNEDIGRTIVDPNSYRAVEQNPVWIMDTLASIPNGIMHNIWVIAIIFAYGGAFGIIARTRLIEDGITRSLDKVQKLSWLIIPIVCMIFSAGGAFVGIQQSFWAFTPLVAVLAVAMGYDVVVAFVMVAVANNIGYMCGPMNVWNVGVAQEISELPMFSGMGLRMFCWLLFMTLLIGYTFIYCRKIKKDPTKSIVYDLEPAIKLEANFEVNFSPRRKAALGLLLAGFLILIYLIGVQGMSSGTQIGAYLIGMSIVVALVNGETPNGIADGFVQGVQNILVPSLVVGMAGGVLLILQQGNTLDAILHAAVTVLAETSSVFAAMMIYLFQFLFNFLVPSGTAQAATTMPIIAPLSDMVGVSRQVSILVFQFGDGFSNMLWPTAVLAPLAFTNIPFRRWIKWFMPFTYIFIVVSGLIVYYAIATGY